MIVGKDREGRGGKEAVGKGTKTCMSARRTYYTKARGMVNDP